jgi:hypothetical protein
MSSNGVSSNIFRLGGEIHVRIAWEVAVIFFEDRIIDSQ